MVPPPYRFDTLRARTHETPTNSQTKDMVDSDGACLKVFLHFWLREKNSQHVTNSTSIIFINISINNNNNNNMGSGL